MLSYYHKNNDLASIFNIRQGGLAIYGGIIAGAITVFVICMVKKINFLAFILSYYKNYCPKKANKL